MAKNLEIGGGQEGFSFRPVVGLWGRFERIRQILPVILSADCPSGIERDFSSHSWGGQDQGIHDFGGTVRGMLKNIDFLLTVKGTVVDHQSRFEIDPNGRAMLITIKESTATVGGNVLYGQDNKEGAFKIGFKNGISVFEAYYLQCLYGYLRLEQVVNDKGEVYDKNSIEVNHRGMAIIPGPRYEVPAKLLKDNRMPPSSRGR